MKFDDIINGLSNFSKSYRVPVPYFLRANFKGEFIRDNKADIRISSTFLDQVSCECLVTKLEHPKIHTPYLVIRPCKTAEVMGELRLPNSSYSDSS